MPLDFEKIREASEILASHANIEQIPLELAERKFSELIERGLVSREDWTGFKDLSNQLPEACSQLYKIFIRSPSIDILQAVLRGATLNNRLDKTLLSEAKISLDKVRGKTEGSKAVIKYLSEGRISKAMNIGLAYEGEDILLPGDLEVLNSLTSSGNDEAALFYGQGILKAMETEIPEVPNALRWLAKNKRYAYGSVRDIGYVAYAVVSKAKQLGVYSDEVVQRVRDEMIAMQENRSGYFVAEANLKRMLSELDSSAWQRRQAGGGP